MSTKERTTPLFYRIGENFFSDFDELQNIEIQNRKSDIGFSEFSKMSIKMRPGTIKVGDTLSGTGGISAQMFFVDFFKVTHHIKCYNNRLYRLNSSSIWTVVGSIYTGNNFLLTPMTLPIMIDGSTPTEYTTTVISSAGERVKKAAADTGASGNIGKYLIILDDTGGSQSYRGAFATIIDYDTATSEYILNGAGITTALAIGAKYRIYDTVGEYVQVSTGVEMERYVYGTTAGGLSENTQFAGLATLGLRVAKSILSTGFSSKQIQYNGLYWTFNKNTLFYSRGTIGNPFFYGYTTSLTVPGSVSGYINDLFVFKDRLVIAGTNYSAHYKGDPTTVTEIKMINQSYGMIPGTLVDVGVDGYFISTNKNIFSLKENIAGTTLIATDEGKVVGNYLNDFNFNLMGGFDGKKLYFYGEKVSGTPGTIIVLDIQFKFWSTYTGLAPNSIELREGKVYISDNNSDTVRYFDSTITTDNGVLIKQKISTKEITLDDVFTIKTLTDLFLWFDNYVQSLDVSIYMSLASYNTRKLKSNITLAQGDIGGTSNPMGTGIIGEGILGGFAVDSNISFPVMKKINLDFDSANIWKVIIEGTDGSPFYLNEMKVSIAPPENKEYFDITNSI